MNSHKKINKMKKINELRIAIDGGAGTGKSTVSKLLSDKLNVNYINTGLFYRLITFIFIKENKISDFSKNMEILKNINFRYVGSNLEANYNFTTDELNSNIVSSNISEISSSKKVRYFVTEKLKEKAVDKRILMEGRDITTVVMPNANFKFFLSVSPEIAAKRRYEEYLSKGININYDKVLKEIIDRNEEDTNRKIAPLKKDDSSILIDTSNKSVNEVVKEMISYIKNEK